MESLKLCKLHAENILNNQAKFDLYSPVKFFTPNQKKNIAYPFEMICNYLPGCEKCRNDKRKFEIIMSGSMIIYLIRFAFSEGLKHMAFSVDR